jgi:hypothetical protein
MCCAVELAAAIARSDFHAIHAITDQTALRIAIACTLCGATGLSIARTIPSVVNTAACADAMKRASVVAHRRDIHNPTAAANPTHPITTLYSNSHCNTMYGGREIPNSTAEPSTIVRALNTPPIPAAMRVFVFDVIGVPFVSMKHSIDYLLQTESVREFS